MAEHIADFCEGIKARARIQAGEKILWVHGYTIDSSLWTELWNALPGYSHIGIDLPGHGLSSSLAAGQTLRGLGERLAAAALREGICHVVGLSLGSIIALQIALSRPADFASLCLAAPALAGGPADAGVGVRYREMAQLHQRGAPAAAMRSLWMRSPPDLFRHAAARPALWEALCKVIERYTWDEFRGPGVARLAIETQTLAELRALRCRTLVLVGEYEFPAFRQTASLLGTHITECAAVELAAAGHLCILEQPELAAQALTRHWAAASPKRRSSAG